MISFDKQGFLSFVQAEIDFVRLEFEIKDFQCQMNEPLQKNPQKYLHYMKCLLKITVFQYFRFQTRNTIVDLSNEIFEAHLHMTKSRKQLLINGLLLRKQTNSILELIVTKKAKKILLCMSQLTKEEINEDELFIIVNYALYGKKVSKKCYSLVLGKYIQKRSTLEDMNKRNQNKIKLTFIEEEKKLQLNQTSFSKSFVEKFLKFSKNPEENFQKSYFGQKDYRLKHLDMKVSEIVTRVNKLKSQTYESNPNFDKKYRRSGFSLHNNCQMGSGEKENDQANKTMRKRMMIKKLHKRQELKIQRLDKDLIQKAVHDYKKENLSKDIKKEKIYLEENQNNKKKKIIKIQDMRIPIIHANKALPKNLGYLRL